MRRLVLAASCVVLVVSACTDAKYSARGTVTSVRNLESGDGVRACLKQFAVLKGKGGSTTDGRYCAEGFVEGHSPEVGECVTLDTQGESSTIEVRRSTACK